MIVEFYGASEGNVAFAESNEQGLHGWNDVSRSRAVKYDVLNDEIIRDSAGVVFRSMKVTQESWHPENRRCRI